MAQVARSLKECRVWKASGYAHAPPAHQPRRHYRQDHRQRQRPRPLHEAHECRHGSGAFHATSASSANSASSPTISGQRKSSRYLTVVVECTGALSI